MQARPGTALTILLGIGLLAAGCGGGAAMPPPPAATNTPLPPPPTEAPTSTPRPAPTNTPQPTPTEVQPTLAPPPATEQQPAAGLAEAAKQIYTDKGCMACHGTNYEGGMGPILVGMPADHIRWLTRNGEPEHGMPAFDSRAISDDDLQTLAEFLSGLTLEDIGVELAPAVLEHLNRAWEALEAGDKAGVETHLTKVQEAAADAPVGLQTTLKDVLEDLEEEHWAGEVEMHLRVLLGK